MQVQWSAVKTACLVTLATLVLLASVEMFLRYAAKAAPAYVDYTFYDNLLGDLPPNTAVVDNLIQGLPYHVTTDAQGLRKAPGLAAPQARRKTVRILCLGDSFTFGVGVDDAYTYPALLRRFLEQRYPDTRFEVFNSGIPFFDIVDELDYWQQKGWKLHPDIVICQFFYNDVQTMNGGAFRRTNRFPPKKYNRVVDAFRNLRLVQAASALAYKLGLPKPVQAGSSEADKAWYAGRYSGPVTDEQATIINTTSRILDQRTIGQIAGRWDAYFRNLLELRRDVTATGAQFLFLSIPDRSQVLTDLHAPSTALNTRLDSAGIAFVDCLPLFRKLYYRNRTEPYNTPYDFHTNKIGNTLIAHELAAAIGVGDAGDIRIVPPRNFPYDAIKNVPLVFDGKTIVASGGQAGVTVSCRTTGLAFQGASADRPQVEITDYNEVPGELTLVLRPERALRYFAVNMRPILFNQAQNGGIKGFVSYAPGQSELLIDRDHDTSSDTPYIYEHYAPEGGITEVTLRFFIGKSTGILFDKNVEGLKDFFVFSYEGATPAGAVGP